MGGIRRNKRGNWNKYIMNMIYKYENGIKRFIIVFNEQVLILKIYSGILIYSYQSIKYW